MTRWHVLLAAATVVVGCRNLDYPSDPEAQNAPPAVRFITPGENDVLPVSPVVQIEARDPNGIVEVTLYCGGFPVFAWTAPPYLASVDLSGCPARSGADAGAGLRAVDLFASATDRLGQISPPVSVGIRLDTSIPNVEVQMPARVAPRGRLELRLRSDRSLATIPNVRIGTRAAEVTNVTELEPVDAPMTAFRAVFDPMPGLGADGFDGGSEEVPVELLEDLEDPALVEIEARGQNGNVFRTIVQVLVSWIAWERNLPGSLYDTTPDRASWPVATDAGLVLPVSVAHDRLSQFMPLFLANDGTAHLFDSTALISDAGYQPMGFNSAGALALIRPAGASYEYLFVDAHTEAVQGTGSTIITDLEAPTRIGRGLCREDLAADTVCGTASTHTWVCITPERQWLGTAQPPAAATDDSETRSSRLAFSGATFVATGFDFITCGSTFHPIVFGAIERELVTLTAVSTADGQAPSRLFPLPDGAFVVSQPLWGAGVAKTFILEADGGVGPQYFPPEALAEMGMDPDGGIPAESLLLARPDRSLVIMRSAPPYTIFESWRPEETTPTGRTRIPGIFEALDPPRGSATADLRTVIQLMQRGSGERSADVVIGFDAPLRPKWIFRPGTDHLVVPSYLFASGGPAPVFVLDTDNERVTALTW